MAEEEITALQVGKLSDELKNIIEAGNRLAAAEHKVQCEYDGVHRLRLALSDWYKVRANEFGRGEES